ncbi:MAG: formate dehydrogenase accessory protein FdhE [Thermodesulfovibrionales bacterium]
MKKVDHSEVTAGIVKRLRTIVKEAPHLDEAAQLYEAMLPLLADADLDPSPVSMTPDQAREKMGKGIPLLRDLDVGLNVDAVRGLMSDLARALEAKGRSKDAYHRLRMALEKETLEAGDLLSHILAGEYDQVASAAGALDLDPGLLLSLAQNALKPALRTWCRQLTPLAEGIPWQKEFCFVCGAGVLLAELQGNEQAMHLRCGQCGADWPHRRLSCVHCGNEDHRTLGYLYAGAQRDKMRAEVCDKCKGYIKVIATFAPTPAGLLTAEDLATLHLDYIAEEHGYCRIAAGQDPCAKAGVQQT